MPTYIHIHVHTHPDVFGQISLCICTFEERDLDYNIFSKKLHGRPGCWNMFPTPGSLEAQMKSCLKYQDSVY